MQYEIIELECPGCGATITTETKTCPYCFRPIVITSFNSISEFSMSDLSKQTKAYKDAMVDHPDHEPLNRSLAFCYLKLKLYDNAIKCFEKELEENIEDSEICFYIAIASLKGKKAFLMPRPVINKIEEYINAAIMTEPRGIYYYFLAYIKYDYYRRKHLNSKPGYQELLEMASSNGVSDYDINQLFDLLGVKKPDALG